MDRGWAVSGRACFGEDAQLRPRLRPAGEPAKQDSGPGDHGGGNGQRNEIKPRQGHSANDTVIESTPLGASRLCRTVAPLLDRSTVAPRRGLSTATRLRDLSTATPLRALATRAPLRDLSAAPLRGLSAASLRGLSSAAPAAIVPLDLLVDLLGRRGVLVQRGIEHLRARNGG